MWIQRDQVIIMVIRKIWKVCWHDFINTIKIYKWLTTNIVMVLFIYPRKLPTCLQYNNVLLMKTGWNSINCLKKPHLTRDSTQFSVFINRTKLGTILNETVLSGDSLYFGKYINGITIFFIIFEQKYETIFHFAKSISGISLRHLI